LREIVEGYRYSLGNPRIRTALMLVGVSSMFGAAYLSMMPAFARDILHGNSTAYGTLMTSVGAGALIGAYLLSQLHERWLTIAPIAAAFSFGCFLIAFSHSGVMWLSIALVMPTACSLMLLGGTTNTIIQTVADEHMRGRVISHYTQCFLGMMPWGSLILGWLAQHLGVTNAVSIGGLVVIASAAFAWFSRSRAMAPA
jgi:predicted MFS family arabinose efflux permease